MRDIQQFTTASLEMLLSYVVCSNLKMTKIKCDTIDSLESIYQEGSTTVVGVAIKVLVKILVGFSKFGPSVSTMFTLG